jgi:hypothetical protein
VKRAALGLLVLLTACPSKSKPVDCHPEGFAERVRALKDPGPVHTTLPLDELPRVGFARRIDGEGTYVESADAGRGDRLLVKGARMLNADGGAPRVEFAYSQAVATIDPHDRASVAAEGLGLALERCPAAKAALASVAAEPPEKKLTVLLTKLADTVPHCTCDQVDFPVVAEWIDEIADEWYAPLGWVPLQR